jgi:hypothetical protein
VNQSLVNETWFFDILVNGRKIGQENMIFDELTDRWLRDFCCTDFSIFNYLPDRQCRLVKAMIKMQFGNEILYVNEWDDSPQIF